MKWAGLAAKGNPSRPELFLGKGHVKPFLGFADDQMKRLLGQKGQKNIHRAELEDKHGYDTKYAEGRSRDALQKIDDVLEAVQDKPLVELTTLVHQCRGKSCSRTRQRDLSSMVRAIGS
jgi:hypothetical protein